MALNRNGSPEGSISKKIVTTKGDLITATANAIPARLAVGNNGETLVADSAATTGLRWQGNYAAGKNKIINGDFGIWQRGTSFSSPSTGSFLADRYYVAFDGSPTVTYSRQTFTPGTAPVAGYESSFFFRAAMTNASTTTSWNVYQKIEDVRTFAGQTVTVSFWAKADTARTVSMNFLQQFGSGGSGDVFGGAGQSNSVTTSWQRFSYTLTLPSISGKTIGTGSSLTLYITLPISATTTVDLWGVQVEAGSVATAFQTATGTLQGELAACQRYYYRNQVDATLRMFGNGWNGTTTAHYGFVPYPVTMRIRPTALEQSGTAAHYQVAHANTATVCSVVPTYGSDTTEKGGAVQLTVASGLTAGQGGAVYSANAAAFLGWSAEL